MLKFLNIFKPKSGNDEILTMRKRFEAAVEEMNAVLAELEQLPAITIDAASRQLEIATPDHFADEALALPKPTEEDKDLQVVAEDDQRSDPTENAHDEAPVQDQKSAA